MSVSQAASHSSGDTEPLKMGVVPAGSMRGPVVPDLGAGGDAKVASVPPARFPKKAVVFLLFGGGMRAVPAAASFAIWAL